jgi:glycerophosphoryl diester phosphodiesterase
MVNKISHRGYIDNKFTMDNSYKSITNAINSNFDMIELDVQLTKDNIIVLYHDLFIANELEKLKMISDMNYSELKDSKSHILTLDDLFKIKNIEKKELYLDLKGNDILADKLINFFNNDFLFNNNIYLGTFNKIHLSKFNDSNIINNSNIKLGLITDNRLLNKDLIDFKKDFNIDFLSLHWEMLREDTVNVLKDINVKCFVYTCKNQFILDEINKFKIDGIVSDIIL